MVKELLPIGSIVLLKTAEKKLMIYGIKQSGKQNDQREYDYLGVLYPEGNINEEYKFLFDHADIEQVYFRGFEDEEREVFIERLEDFYQEHPVA